MSKVGPLGNKVEKQRSLWRRAENQEAKEKIESVLERLRRGELLENEQEVTESILQKLNHIHDTVVEIRIYYFLSEFLENDFQESIRVGENVADLQLAQLYLAILEASIRDGFKTYRMNLEMKVWVKNLVHFAATYCYPFDGLPFDGTDNDKRKKKIFMTQIDIVTHPAVWLPGEVPKFPLPSRPPLLTMNHVLVPVISKILCDNSLTLEVAQKIASLFDAYPKDELTGWFTFDDYIRPLVKKKKEVINWQKYVEVREVISSIYMKPNFPLMEIIHGKWRTFGHLEVTAALAPVVANEAKNLTIYAPEYSKIAAWMPLINLRFSENLDYMLTWKNVENFKAAGTVWERMFSWHGIEKAWVPFLRNATNELKKVPTKSCMQLMLTHKLLTPIEFSHNLQYLLDANDELKMEHVALIVEPMYHRMCGDELCSLLTHKSVKRQFLENPLVVCKQIQKQEAHFFRRKGAELKEEMMEIFYKKLETFGVNSEVEESVKEETILPVLEVMILFVYDFVPPEKIDLIKTIGRKSHSFWIKEAVEKLVKKFDEMAEHA